MRAATQDGDRLLAALCVDQGPLDASTTCLVVAHPDDESIACGGQIDRLAGLSVVLVTDGGPRNLTDARNLGFNTAAAYAQTRAAEFHLAMKLSKVSANLVTTLNLPDQQAAQHLTWLAAKLADLFWFKGIRIAITHSYEGGHPDHDAVAFSVHAARALLRRRGGGLDIIEAPLYRAGDTGMLLQSFAPSNGAAEIRLQLDPGARRKKQRLLDVYATQRATLSAFTTETESFRLSENYDFTLLPNGSRLLYEDHDWGLTGRQWRALAGRSLQQLGLSG